MTILDPMDLEEITDIPVDFADGFEATEIVDSFTVSVFTGGAGAGPNKADEGKSTTVVSVWISTKAADGAAVLDGENWEFSVTAIGDKTSPVNSKKREYVRWFTLPIRAKL